MWSNKLANYESDIVRFAGRLELKFADEQPKEYIEEIESLLRSVGVFKEDIEYMIDSDSGSPAAIYFNTSEVLFNPNVWSKVLGELDKYIWIPDRLTFSICPHNYVEFVGDEYEHWRFVRSYDGWYDQTGEINYDEGMKIEVRE